MSVMRDALGYGYVCPYCGMAQEEGRSTGVSYRGKPVCKTCAPVLQAARAAAGPIEADRERQFDARMARYDADRRLALVAIVAGVCAMASSLIVLVLSCR